MSKSHWKDESRNSLWWHWWKPWWSIYTWQMNNTMWIKQHTRHKRVCCFLRCCCCVVRRVRTWEEEEKLWAIPISRRPPGGHFINYFGLLTAHSIQNLFWTQFRVTTQSQSDGYQPTNLGDDDSENAPTTTAIYSNDPPMAKKLIWKNDFLWALSHFHQLMAYTQQTPFFLSLLILSTRCDKYYDVRTRTPETDPRKKGRKRLDGRKRQSDARDVVK